MKLRKFTAILLYSLTITNFAFAEDTSVLSGGIDIEQNGALKSSYQKVQDDTAQFFEKFKEKLLSLGSGNAENLPDLNDNDLQYLNAVYLYCAVRQGTCPYILDGVLEVDIANSKASNKANCPVSTKFWKLWVKNDMEERQKYMIQTGFLASTQDFNTNTRPRYIKCIPTVEEAIGTSKDEFLKRYKEGGTGYTAVTKMAELLGALRDKHINVFVATGSGSKEFSAPAPKADQSNNSNKLQ